MIFNGTGNPFPHPQAWQYSFPGCYNCSAALEPRDVSVQIIICGGISDLCKIRGIDRRRTHFYKNFTWSRLRDLYFFNNKRASWFFKKYSLHCFGIESVV